MDEILNLSLEELLEHLSPNFYISRTFFEEEDKKYIIAHNCSIVQEYNEPYTDISDWDFAGLNVENRNDILIVFYGKSAKDTLVKFFQNYPKFYVFNNEEMSTL